MDVYECWDRCGDSATTSSFLGGGAVVVVVSEDAWEGDDGDDKANGEGCTVAEAREAGLRSF